MSSVNSETAAFPSASPDDARSSQLTSASPDLMNVSPLSQQSTPSIDSGKPLDDALRQREWLMSQKSHLLSQIKALETDISSEVDALPEDRLLDMYESLKQELLHKSVTTDSRELLLKQKHISQAMMTVINSSNQEDTDPQIIKQKKQLDSLMVEFMSLMSQIGTCQKQKDQMRQGVDKIKKENLELLRKSRELYCEIEKKKNEREEEMKLLTIETGENSLHERLETKLQQLTLTNSVTQGLILGSGVNWAQDETLNTLMIEAEPFSVDLLSMLQCGLPMILIGAKWLPFVVLLPVFAKKNVQIMSHGIQTANGNRLIVSEEH